MAAAKFILALLALCAITVGSYADTSCPFDKDICTCSLMEPSKPNDFSTVLCNGMPTLQAPPGQKYTTITLLIKSDQVINLPANYFSAFTTISQLHLVRQSAGPPLVQQWDAHAFDGVQIMGINFNGIDGVLPPPASLQVLGTNGLSQYTVQSCMNPSDLGMNAFGTLALQILVIDTCQITISSDQALDSLGATLTQLTITNSGLMPYPMTFQKLTALTAVDLSNNKLTTIPQNALQVLSKLNSLTLDGNPMGQYIDDGLLDPPASLVTLSIMNMGYYKIPTYLIRQDDGSKLVNLFFKDNRITEIKNGDLVNGTKLLMIFFCGNPVSNVELGSFQYLKSVQELGCARSNLTQFDFAVFNGMNGGALLKFNDQSHLQKVTVSSLKDFPANFTVSMPRAAVQDIDASLAGVFQSPLNANFDLSNSTNLQCANLNWIATDVYCSDQVTIDGCECVDKKESLNDYLKQAVPNPCSNSAASMSGAISMVAAIMTGIIALGRI